MRLPLRPSHASCFIVLLIEIELAAKSVAVGGGGRGSWQHMCLQIIFNILFALCYKLRHKTSPSPIPASLSHVAVVVVVLTFDCIYPPAPLQRWLTPPTV